MFEESKRESVELNTGENDRSSLTEPRKQPLSASKHSHSFKPDQFSFHCDIQNFDFNLSVVDAGENEEVQNEY